MTLFHLWNLPGDVLAAPESASGLDRCNLSLSLFLARLAGIDVIYLSIYLLFCLIVYIRSHSIHLRGFYHLEQFIFIIDIDLVQKVKSFLWSVSAGVRPLKTARQTLGVSRLQCPEGGAGLPKHRHMPSQTTTSDIHISTPTIYVRSSKRASW